ncbi:MAG: hypothetical protein OQJ84_02605, partial [Xanthomonadales bacterium]|nr:hypothetical protein [Xanthomonadales bacterium]
PLMRVRLELGFHYFPGLDDESRRLLRDQLLLGWKLDKRGVIDSLADGRLDFGRVEDLLSGYAQDVLGQMMAHPRLHQETGR